MASQRERLLDGVVEAAARHGYGGASVARVIEAAGVSRATFYEHFSNREECFLAAYRRIVKRIVHAVEGAGRLPAAERLRFALSALLAGAERDPAAAQVLAIEGLAAGSAVWTERERMLVAIDGAVQRYLRDLPEAAARPQIPNRALIGGVEGVVATRLYRGESARFGALLFDLLDWVDSYALPSGQAPLESARWVELGAALRRHQAPQPGDARPAHLPRGRAAAAPGVVAREHRERILAAIAALSREKGYARTTVADVVAAARVSRESFYRQFRGKENAFHATQISALQATISRAAEAFFGADAWPDRVWRGLEALLVYAGENPDLAYLDVVDSCAVGAGAIHRSFENRMAFNLFLEEGYRQRPEARRLPRLCSDAIGAAIFELLRGEILAGRGEGVVGILPQAVYLSLAPFVGPGRALEFVRQRTGESVGLME